MNIFRFSKAPVKNCSQDTRKFPNYLAEESTICSNLSAYECPLIALITTLRATGNPEYATNSRTLSSSKNMRGLIGEMAKA